MNYFKLLYEKSKIYRDKPFLILDGNVYSYRMIYKQSNLLGLAIKKNISDVNQGIFIYSGSMFSQILAFFAVQASDNIPIICQYPISNNILKILVEKNKIKYIITQSDCNLPFNYITLKNILLYNTTSTEYKNISPYACMGVLTSGSTNIPKVLFRTYESWANFFNVQNRIFKVDEKSRFFISGSLSFTGNLNFICALLYAGATIIGIMPLQIHSWAYAIKNYSVTHIYLIPTKLKVFRFNINWQAASVKMILTGSQILKNDLLTELEYKFPNAEIIEYYGATEVNYVSYLRGKELYKHPQSIGRPFPGINVFIKDDLIYIDTKYHVIGLDSPCTVYDMGHFDNTGYLFFDGRKDGIVNCGGYKINIAKVEQALLNIDVVNEAAIVCHKDNLRENYIEAFVTLLYPAKVNYIRDELKNILSIPELPRKITILNSFPLNSSGKIDRSKL